LSVSALAGHHGCFGGKIGRELVPTPCAGHSAGILSVQPLSSQCGLVLVGKMAGFKSQQHSARIFTLTMARINPEIEVPAISLAKQTNYN
jgi:hypothetical protein